MNITDLFENNNDDDENNGENGEEQPTNMVKTKRGARLTMSHLLKLRDIREKKKLQHLKDLELYYVMYGPAGGDEGGGGF